MKFTLTPESTVEVSNGGAKVVFPLGKLLESKEARDHSGMFDEINAYIETLDFVTQHAIFKIYSDIRALRDDILVIPFSTQQRETTTYVKDLYNLLDLDRLAKFILRDNYIARPANLLARDSAEAREANLNENINYYMEDYDGLIVLVLALRPMVPIWGEYIVINKTATGPKHVDHQAFLLLRETPLYYTEYMDRLRSYIDEIRGSNSNQHRELADDAGALEGISSESLTEYLLAKLLVKRVAITSIHATANVSIISNIFGNLRHNISEAIRFFRLSPKYDESTSSIDKKETSMIEKYKIASRLTHGDIQFIKTAARNPIGLLTQLDPSIPQELLGESLMVNNRNDFTIEEHCKLLTQWTLYHIFPPMGVYELNRNEFINLISVAQAALVYWEIYDLAAIIAASRDDNTFNATSTTRSGIDERLLEKLDRIYPYRKSSKRQQDKSNLAHNEITKFMIENINRDFNIRVTPTLETRAGMTSGVFACPVGIINSLAKLLIKANETGEKREQPSNL